MEDIMKKTKITKIAALAVLTVFTVLSFVACAEAKKTEDELLNDAKGFVTSAKEELVKVKDEAVTLEEDTTTIATTAEQQQILTVLMLTDYHG